MVSHISIKFLVIGDEKVGKTTIINYFTLLPMSIVSTVGIDFQSRMIAVSSHPQSADPQRQCLYIETNETNETNQTSKIQVKSSNNPNNTSSTNNINNKKIKHYHFDNSSESETLILSTMKLDIDSVIRPIDYDYVKCCFWDTSGSPNYECLAHSYYTGIAAIIVVFDLSNQLSYNGVKSYISRVIQKNTCNHSHPFLVLGNKVDQRSISFTKKQVFEDLSSTFPHENIRYEEVSCLDKLNALSHGCAGCASSTNIHIIFNSFIQSLYDSVIKPHYYNPLAIAAIGCRGITGTSRFFREQRENKNVEKKGWNWKGSYTDYIRGVNTNQNTDTDYIEMINLKVPRECCNKHGLERVSSCTSGCFIM